LGCFSSCSGFTSPPYVFFSPFAVLIKSKKIGTGFLLTDPVSYLPSPFIFRRIRCFVMSKNVKEVLFLDGHVMLEA
jgi:hypothetical protein